MERFKIITDSCSDLSVDEAHQLGIDIIPMSVNFGQDSYEETSLTRDQFWRMAAERGVPTTSQPPAGVFHEVFQHWLESGYRVICLIMTGAHSGAFGTASSAALAFGDRVTVVDSRALSWGVGWQAMAAARLALQGATREAILGAMRSIRERTHLVFMINTLEYLRRGGRVAKIMPTIDRLARALSLRPVMNLPDGEARLLGMVRSYQKGMERVKEEMVRLGPWERLAVMHTRRSDAAHDLADGLAPVTGIPRAEIQIGEVGAVVASHGGEGLIAAIGVRLG